MSAQKILDAFATLLVATPGASDHMSISIHDCRDFRDFVCAFGARVERFENDARTEEWDCASVYAPGVTLYAYSQHRPLKPVSTIDEANLANALAAVKEAVRS